MGKIKSNKNFKVDKDTAKKAGRLLAALAAIIKAGTEIVETVSKKK